MYFEHESVEGNLTCAFCNSKLSGVVKLIPDCGHSICSECYRDLAGEFECRACGERHQRPQSGLPDNKLAMRMLKLVPKEKALSEDDRELKSLLAELNDKIADLSLFSELDEIHLHFDGLALQVREAVQSAIDQLNKAERELLEQIELRRQLNVDSSTGRIGEARRQSEALIEKMRPFLAKWSEYFGQVSKPASHEEVDAARSEARSYDLKLALLRNRMKREALGDRVVRFDETHLRSLPEDADPAARLLVEESAGNSGRLKDRIKFKLARTLTGHEDSVSDVLFHPSGLIVSCSYDKRVKVWNIDDGKEICELRGHTDSVTSLAVLTNGWLACASNDSKIYLWDLDTVQPIKTLAGHSSYVDSLAALRNGFLASASRDDTVKVWNPTSGGVAHSMPGHGIKWWGVDLGTLSNGFLVTCSNDKDSVEESVIRIWDPHRAKLVESVPAHHKGASCLLVLLTDHVAIGFDDGALKIFDLVDETRRIKLLKAHEGGLMSLAQLPSGHLLSGNRSFSSTIKVWSPTSGALLQTILTGHTSTIWSLAVSRDGRWLASGSTDNGIKLWSLALEAASTSSNPSSFH